MSERNTRRTFLKHSAATLAALQATALALAADGKARARYICVTCGIQFKETDGPPKHCPVCEDERQYVGWEGQKWTTWGA
jgi:rubrerythrin